MCEKSLFRYEPGLMPEYIENLVKEIAVEEGIDDFKIAIAPDSFKGDNYLGQINQVRITGTKNNQLAEIALIVKISPTGKHLRDSIPINKYYCREIHAYSKVLPTLSDLHKSSGGRLEYAKFYRGLEEAPTETVILEDLCYKGFRSYKKTKSLDKDHLKLVIETLAKYHASSFALQNKNPKLFEALSSQAAQKLEYHDMLGKVMENTKKTFLSGIEDPENRERIAIYLEDMMDKFENYVKPETSAPYNVLCHGDCWTNNFLFLYDNENEKPLSTIFLDWQLTRLASPITDIAYMIYSSTNEETRSGCLDYLLDLYYDTVKSTISSLGCDPAVCYPETVFREQVKTIMPFGLITSFMVLPVFLSDPDDDVEEDKEGVDESRFTRAFSELCNERLRETAREFLNCDL